MSRPEPGGSRRHPLTRRVTAALVVAVILAALVLLPGWCVVSGLWW